MSKLSKFIVAVAAAAGFAIAPLQAGTALGADLPACTIQGTSANETLNGTAGPDVICTGGGNDVVYAFGGDDFVIVEGAGTVEVDLGIGNDTFYGGYGLAQYHAVVEGGDGADEITGTPGDDVIYGDAGEDTVYGGSGADQIYGGTGSDNLQGESGDDKIQGEAGDDDINGGWGADTLRGDAGNDTLLGGYANDMLYGSDGYDYLQGDTGADYLYGEAGTDQLAGGDGDDIIAGGDGTDTLEGGWGINLCDYSTGEIKGKTCKYDDIAPVIVSATWDKASYETGTADVTIGLDVHLTDEVAVRAIWVQCGNDVIGMGYNWTGFQKDVTTKLTRVIPKGYKPGVYDCYAWGYDQVNNFFYKQVASLQLTRKVGDWDDDAPVVESSAWNPYSYEVGHYSQTGYLELHLTDRTGINNISLQCDDLWAWAYNLGTNLDNPTLASHSGTIKDFYGTMKLNIPYGHKPGEFQCNMWIYDLKNNLRYQQVAPLIITRDEGNWDEAAPVVEASSWNQDIYDAGQTAQNALLSLHITDQSGIRSLYVSCGSVVWTPLWDMNLDNLRNNPAIASVQGTQQDLYITFSNTILLGQYPGKYPCYVWGNDTFNNGFWHEIDPLMIWRTPPGMPNEPTNLAYELTTASAGTLSWTPPSVLGNPALKDYVVQYSLDAGATWKTIKDGYSTTPRLPISNLKDDTDYLFRVRGENGGAIDEATNQFMELAWATLSVHTPSAVAPQAPTDLAFTNVTKNSFQMNWKTPVDDGGANISNFTVELSRDGGNTWVSAKETDSTSQQFTVLGAAPGTNYQVRISAINKAGASTYLTGSTKTLTTNASKPQNLRLYSQANGIAVLNWDLPATNGGTGISDYKVEVTSGTTWTTINHAASNSLSFTVTGLKKGVNYRVRVTAYTSIGYGDSSDILSFIADTSAPSIPLNLAIGSITKSTAVVTWATPADTGGLPVIDYVVETSVDNGMTWLPVNHKASNSTKMTLSNLTGATNYLVRVSAKNATGVSESATEAFSTIAGTPGAPRNLTATAPWPGLVSLSWVTPTWDNGAAITDYQVEASSDGGAKWTIISHDPFVGEGFNVSGLKAGTTYSFRVSAVNVYGAGDPSAVVQVTTEGSAPAAPTALKATTKTTTSVTLSWTAAKVVGGSPVREYIVQYSKNGGVTWIKVNAVTFKSTSITVKGFKSKTAYRFRVMARNDVGTSVASNVIVVATK